MGNTEENTTAGQTAATTENQSGQSADKAGAGAEQQTDTTQQQQESTDPAAELEKWKKLSRQNEARAKENADKAKEWQAWKDSQKSPEDKEKDELEQLRSENRTLKLKDLRAKVAKDEKLPDGASDFLTGDTEEALLEEVGRLKALLGVSAVKKAPDTQGMGNTGGSVHGEKDRTPADIVAAATKR